MSFKTFFVNNIAANCDLPPAAHITTMSLSVDISFLTFSTKLGSGSCHFDKSWTDCNKISFEFNASLLGFSPSFHSAFVLTSNRTLLGLFLR